MRSVVIHLKKKPQEWHLVESLFYKVQASKDLIFLEINSNDSINWDYLFKQVLTYIVQNRFDHWQLILLNNNEPTNRNRASLTKELHVIKQKLLYKLKDKGIVPSRKILLTLDGLKRNADFSPANEQDLIDWEIDNFGYIKGGTRRKANLFIEEEVLSINQGWGEFVNLKDAGVIENPNETFIQDLQKRKQLVKGSLKKLIKDKKQYINQLIWDSDVNDDLLTDKMLDTVYQEFCTQLDEMCSPPFSYNLNTFLPSNQLKTILKENFGISSIIDEFLLIRKTNSDYSPFQKIRALLEYAFLLNAIVLKPEVLDRVGNGFSYEVDLVLRDEELKEMYANYYTCLLVAKEKIENRNLGQEHYMTNKFAEINVLPYSAPLLEDQFSQSPSFNGKSSRNFMSDWNLYLHNIEMELQQRAINSLESAKEGVRVLAVTKRQTNDHVLQEKININDYADTLIRTKDQIQSELDNEVPSLTKSVAKWNSLYPSIKNRMNRLISSLPSQNILISAFLVSLFALLIPYLTSVNGTDGKSTYTTISLYIMIPLSILCTVIYLSYITLRKQLKPIHALTEETTTIQRSLANEQKLAHTRYNEYLNKMYKLFRIRNQYRELEDKASKQKEENILYRWHQGEVYSHVTVVNQLMDSLQIELKQDQKEKCISFFNTTFDVSKHVYKNPIYSPLDCQFDRGLKGHSMEVYVVNSRDEITTWTLNPIEKIRFSQDKVYTI